MSDEQTTGGSELRVGVIGLGMIGGGVAAHAAAAGLPLSVYDVVPTAFERIDGVEAQAAAPRRVAEASDVVVIAVVTAAQARDVLVGEDGLLAGRADGLVVVLMSTVSVPAVHELAALCAEHGAQLLDAGVTQAGDGRLAVMLGGPDEAVARVSPVLDAVAAAVVHCGPLGSGMVTKLARNAVTYGAWAVVREAVALATAAGVDPARVLDVMDAASAGGTAPEARLRQDVEQGGMPAETVAYADALAQKDLAAAQELAGDLGVETPLIDVVRPRMAAAFGGDYGAPLPEDAWERGMVTARRVYGDQLPPFPRDAGMPAMQDTVEHLFGRIWARGHLSTRDRRLLALGATTMLGRQDLLETQLRGAIGNGELTVAQLREIELFMNYYGGVENGSAILIVIEKLIAEGAAS